MIEQSQKVLKLSDEQIAALEKAVETENRNAALRTLTGEHMRRRNLLADADMARSAGRNDLVASIEAAIRNERSAKKEWDAWEDFIRDDPSAQQAVEALFQVSHLEPPKPTLLDTAFTFFFHSAQKEPDKQKFDAAIDRAKNAIKGRHLTDEEKQGYYDRLQLLVKTRELK